MLFEVALSKRSFKPMKVSRHNNAEMINVDARNEPGVYVIANLASEKVYIGSSYRLRDRLTSHLWHLRKGEHRNRHLQSAWDKYGEDAFICAPLEYVALEELEIRERELIETHRAASYNLRLIPERNRGFKHSAATRALMSERAKAFCNTPEYRERMRQLHSGKTLSEKTRAKIAAAKLGKNLSEEHKQAMRDADRKPLPTRSAKHNAKIAATKARAGIATAPDGTEYSFTNLRQFCRERGLQQSNMGKVARGAEKSHKSWACRYLDA
jgi:group I intron endonuclease